MNERTLDVVEYIAMSDRNGVGRAMKVWAGLKQRDGSRKKEKPRRMYDPALLERIDAIVWRLTGDRPNYGTGTPEELENARPRRHRCLAEREEREEAKERESGAEERAAALVTEEARQKAWREADAEAGRRWAEARKVEHKETGADRFTQKLEAFMGSSRKLRRKLEKEAGRIVRRVVKEEIGAEAPAAAVKEIARDMMRDPVTRNASVTAVKAIKHEEATAMGFGAEITGHEWQEGRRDIEVIRALGENWTGISRIMDDDYEPGYARSAYDSKHVMKRESVRRLREFVNAIDPAVVEGARQVIAKEKAGMKQTPEELKVKDNPRFIRLKAIFDELVGLGLKKEVIAREAFGYTQGGTLHNTLQRRGDPGEERLAQAEAYLTRVKDERKGRHAANGKHKHGGPPMTLGEIVRAEEPAPPPRAAPKPAPTVRDPYAWIADVQAGLLALAEKVEGEKATAPAMFRGPYDVVIEKLTKLAEEFER